MSDGLAKAMKSNTESTEIRATEGTERKTKKFLTSYFHDGCRWSVEIDAYDFTDAEARVKKLGYLQLDGELIAKVPARIGFGARALCWIRNTFKA